DRLLNRRWQQRAVGADSAELVWAGKQSEQHVPERAVRGFDAGWKQQPQEREDLLVGELLTVDLGACESADEILAGLLSPGGEDRREVLLQCLRSGATALRIDGERQQRDRPALKLRVELARQAQQAGDDLRRVRECELHDQVCAAPIGEQVDQLVSNLADELVLPAS